MNSRQLLRSLLAMALLAACASLFVSAASSSASVSNRLAQRGIPVRALSATDPASPSAADQADAAFDDLQSALSEAIVAEVNAANASWTAAMNPYFDGKSRRFLQRSCGTKIDAKLGSASAVSEAPLPVYPLPSPSESQPALAQLPTEFDARVQWGATCPSVHDIRDQAGCGSCWAVAAAESMTDRHCIASGGARQPYLSAHNILTCCGLQTCGSCEGGYPLNAWQFWVSSGVVTGGAYGSTGTCQPYTWAPCEHHTNGSRPQCVAMDATPACSATCTDGINFNQDKNFGNSAYKVSGETAIMRELMTHGPVEAGFMVFEDFPHYQSGVYHHVKGKMIGGHAIKLVGWGVENGVKYWHAANSWNYNWGSGGFFKIARGQNECMIEDMVYAGRVRA